MFDKLKKWVVDQVMWAEANMKGKTGKEKRQAVVDKLDSLITLPWFLEWMDGPLIGWLVDMACSVFNKKNGHDWGNKVQDTKEVVKAVVKELPDPPVPEKAMEAVTAMATPSTAVAMAVIETAKKETTQAVANNLASVTNKLASEVKTATQDSDKLSAHFSKKEFACKCCGKFIPCPELVEKLEKFRALCGNKPLTINSACRCEKHNKAVGGSAKSQHLLGKAADVRKVLGLTIDQMAKKAEEAGFTGIGKYNSFVHVDVRPTPTKWDYRK